MRIENANQGRRRLCDHGAAECLRCGFGLPDIHVRWVSGVVRYVHFDQTRGPRGMHNVFVGVDGGDVCVEISPEEMREYGYALPPVGAEARFCLAWRNSDEAMGTVIAVESTAPAGGGA